ncbi:MAG: hypothetical protein AcusKO_36350 [Acuticoccus sp.]
MRKQIFEILPDGQDLHAHYELLRYENASQRAEIATLEETVERLQGLVDALEDKLDDQQEVIDLLNAELVRRPASGGPEGA